VRSGEEGSLFRSQPNGAGPQTVQIEAQNSGGATAQVEFGYPGPKSPFCQTK